MAAVGEWVKTLIVVVLLGNLVDFALPKGDLKRYGGLVVGLVILATMISPLWKWFHQLRTDVASGPSLWSNTSSGFSQVVESEELHQAESIVLSMPHITQCQLSLRGAHTVYAIIGSSQAVDRATLTHYVKAALQVTMGNSLHVQLVSTRKPQVHYREQIKS